MQDEAVVGGRAVVSRPPGLPEPGGLYSHAVRVPAGGLLFLSGQVGRDAAGRLAEGFEGQLRQAFDNVALVLESQDLGFADVVKFTTYVVRTEDVPVFYEVRADIYGRAFPDGDYPANSLLVVTGLAREDLLVEVETVAALGRAV